MRFFSNWVNERKDPFRNFKRILRKMHRARMTGDMHKAIHCRDTLMRKYACCISPLAEIAEDVEFPHPVGIVIGDGVVVQSGCTIYQNVTLGRAKKTQNGYPIISNGCILYAGAVVVGDIIIESGTVVAANAVVVRGNTVKNDVLAGVPAKSTRIRY